MIEQRKYQIDAFNAIMNDWASGIRRTLLVLPTGCGKTVVATYVIDAWLKKNKDTKVLFLAHRGELLDQAAKTMHDVAGLECSLEKASSTSIGTENRVVLASVQTLYQERRHTQFPKDYFSAIIIDEAHHSTSDSYQIILKYFDSANVLGITATPDRGDLRNLGSFYENCAFEYQLKDAVKDKFLVPVRAKVIPLEIDISKVRVTKGDYSAGDIGNFLDEYLEKIADEVVKHCKDKKTVVFLPLIKTSKTFCKLLKKRGMKAAEINGQSDDREKVLAAFRKGKYNVLCNAMLLTEGWDCPDVECVIVLRPTRSRSLYQQMVGRGMRLAEGKTELLLLDFLWLTAQHGLCRPSCIISRDEDIAKRIDEKMCAAEDGVLIDEAEAEAERDIVSERESALAEELDKMRKGTSRTGGVNPIQYAVSVAAEELLSYSPVFAWEYEPPTQKQLDYISRSGIETETVFNRGHASVIINLLINRKKNGFASPKQIRFLESRGFMMVGTWSFAAANAMIDAIAQNYWQIPDGIDPDSYMP